MPSMRWSPSRDCSRFLSLILCLMLSLALPAQAVDFQPNILPELDIRPAAGEIDVDGELDDSGWQGAVRAENFSETSPGDNTAPPVQTSVLVTYDETHFFLAFIVEDDPATVITGHRDRDEIFSDDYVGIILDTYGDQAWAYEFFVNPQGFQGDLRMSAVNGEDMGFDLVWQSRGRLTDTGYQVEVAIPFASLRFPDADEQVWRATFWRDRKTDFRERNSWAAIDRDDPCWLCQFGTLRGIRGVKPGGGLTVLPSMVAHQSSGLADAGDPGSEWTGDDFRADYGLGLAYSFGPNFAIEGTLNPDFSQVESDAAQIDVNTPFALFYPERRPFFQRGSNLFHSWVNAIYTRSINDPYAAGKVTVRRGPLSLLYLAAQDEHSPLILPFEESSNLRLGGKSLSNILRLRRSFDGGSFIGGLLTDRRHGSSFDKHGLMVPNGGGHGTVGGLDFSLRFLSNWNWEFQVLASHTEETEDSLLSDGLEGKTFDGGLYTAALDGETYWGHAAYCSFERNGRIWSFDMDLNLHSPSFRAENGFIASNNRRSVDVWSGWNFRLNRGFIDNIHPQIMSGGIWNYAGKQKDQWFMAQVNMNLTKQTWVQLHQMWSAENYGGHQFDGIRRSRINFNTSPVGWLQFGGDLALSRTIARFGDPPFLGDQISYEAWAAWKPTPRLRIQPSITYQKMTRPDDDSEVFAGYLLRSRVKVQFSRRLFLRTILQYDDFDGHFDLEPLLSYKVNPFTVLYLGSTHAFDDYGGDESWRQRERQFFLKMQYLFQT